MSVDRLLRKTDTRAFCEVRERGPCVGAGMRRFAVVEISKRGGPMKNQVSSVGRRALQFAAFTFGLALNAAAVADANYIVHNLVSNQPGVADHQDGNLRNAWGIVFGPTNPVWVSDNASGVSTVYDGSGKLLLTVTIPGGANTGITFNPSTTDFQITCGAPPTSASALF